MSVGSIEGTKSETCRPSKTGCGFLGVTALALAAFASVVSTTTLLRESPSVFRSPDSKIMFDAKQLTAEARFGNAASAALQASHLSDSIKEAYPELPVPAACERGKETFETSLTSGELLRLAEGMSPTFKEAVQLKIGKVTDSEFHDRIVEKAAAFQKSYGSHKACEEKTYQAPLVEPEVEEKAKAKTDYERVHERTDALGKESFGRWSKVAKVGSKESLDEREAFSQKAAEFELTAAATLTPALDHQVEEKALFYAFNEYIWVLAEQGRLPKGEEYKEIREEVEKRYSILLGATKGDISPDELAYHEEKTKKGFEEFASRCHTVTSKSKSGSLRAHSVAHAIKRTATKEKD